MSDTQPNLLGQSYPPDPVVENCVNAEQIRFWIHDCEENHGDRCNNAEHEAVTPVTMLRLIDVVDLCIISAPPQVRYFALSYVWGEVEQLQLTIENCAELSRPRSLERYLGTIPATTQDAVQFVGSLNERYLWVDSLCIVQNDVTTKHEQILQMGSIYNGAVACLVGAVGVDSNSGLAGVRPQTRTPEKRRPQYEDVYLIDPGPEQYTALRKPRDNSPFVKLERRVKARSLDLRERLIKSHYNSRAWTYQERLLSRRCIYFMENMIYFHCRSVIRGENKTTPYSQNSEDIRHLSLFMADPIFSGEPTRYSRTLGATYTGLVVEITRKKLSFPVDILKSFSGIAAAMEKLCAWRFVAGMPESLIEYALLWVPSKGSPRRLEEPGSVFPSWSWAGWHTEADYSNIFRTEKGFEPYLAEMQSLIHQLHICDQNGYRSIHSVVSANEVLNIDGRNSSQTEVNEWLNRIRDSQVPRIVLIFQALSFPVLSFEVEKHWHIQGGFRMSDQSFAPSNHTVRVRFEIGREVHDGHLFYAEIPLFAEHPNHDIILLSLVQGAGYEIDCWEADRLWTNIMLVQWKGDFAERLAVGQLAFRKKESLEYLNNLPNWKTIRLT